MRIVGLVLLSLVAQRILGWPGLPPWIAEFYVPMTLVVAYALIHHDRKWTYAGIGFGLAWDIVMMETLIGPGGIAWGACFVAVHKLGQFVADRRARMWALAGGVGTLVFIVTREIALLPLGRSGGLVLMSVFRSIILTALLCGVTGAVFRLDLPRRIAEYQARKLR